MTDRVDRHGLSVDSAFDAFIADRALPGTGIDADTFFAALAGLVNDLAPRNRELLAFRDSLQAQIDQWHREHAGQPHDAAAYKAFLEEIGYLLPQPDPAPQITTENVDTEITAQPGPQLVVPVMNARFALNAANARWGSLYDALYGTDVISEDNGAMRAGGYNPVRGNKVIAWARNFLDRAVPLANGSHVDATTYAIRDGQLIVTVDGDLDTGLAEPAEFVGYRGDAGAPSAVLLRHNGLHIEIVIDRDHPVGKDDEAGVADVVLESAITTIQDCEDSVAAVDAADKIVVYGNWLGLMKGDLIESFAKGGKTVTRELVSDREYAAPDGSGFTLPGRSLLLVRNVGHLMTTDAVLDGEGHEIPEGILDALTTVAIAIHDLKGARLNSR
ncbi:MAG: malate synthase G, partial [Pseudomonadota bacterium]